MDWNCSRSTYGYVANASVNKTNQAEEAGYRSLGYVGGFVDWALFVDSLWMHKNGLADNSHEWLFPFAECYDDYSPKSLQKTLNNNMPNVNRKKIPSSKLKFAKLYNKFSTKVTRATGRPLALLIAFSVILIWAVTGPIFQYSDTWQLVINTGTTIITFLMVFIIQQSQNKDTTALQLKLNELIAANANASNRLIDIEDLTEEELLVLKKFYIKLADLAEKESDVFKSHSLDEAERNNTTKRKSVTVKKSVTPKTKTD